MKSYNECTICRGAKFTSTLHVKDFSVSQEMFNIDKCNSCGFHFTNPIPEIDEIGKYYKSENYVSHSSSKKGIINKIYHVVRKYSLFKKVKLINRINVNSCGKLLDYGAGTGHFVSKAKQAGWDVIGLELDEDARNLSKELHDVELLSVSELSNLAENNVDIITLWHVLEHIHDLRGTLASLLRKLNKDGKIVIAVPNRNSFDANYYKEFWAAYDVPIHLYHFVEEDLVLLLNDYDYVLDKVMPMKFDSYYVSMLSEKYKRGNLLRALWIGFLSNIKAKKVNYSSKIYVFKAKNA